jgi:hypothetical protein
MPAVGLADPDLVFFSAQQVKTEKKLVKDSTLGLIQVVKGHLIATSLYGGLIQQFQWQWTWKVVEKGADFIVQFPSSEKLKMMMEFDEFRLKGTNAYIKVSNVNKKVLPVGRIFSVRARAEGVPDESKHYKGICEVGSLIGVVDDVDMQILSDLDMVRFQANVMSISKFPMVRRYVVKPWAYDITFFIEKVIEKGTIKMTGCASMDVDQQGAEKSREVDPKLDEEEAARASKKQKSSEADTTQKLQEGTGPEGPDVVNKVDTAVLPSVGVHKGDVSEEDRSQSGKDKMLANQGSDESAELLKDKEKCMGYVAENAESLKHADQVEKTGEEELDEELVDYEESQEKFQYNDDGEDDLMESEESFSTKVKKMTTGTTTKDDLIQVKLEKDRGKQSMVSEEPRRCPRLRSQEDADRIDLAMKRAAQKNEIPGKDLVVPTVLNSSPEILISMSDRLGVCAEKKEMHGNIVSVIQSLEQTKKIMFEESKKEKNMYQPKSSDLFTQVTEELDDMAEDSDDDLVMDTSPGKGQLNKSGNNKIMKLCSPVFRVELAKKRGRPPKNK